MANLDQLGLPDGSTYNFKDNTQERSDHRHYDSDSVPLISKKYESTSYYATTASSYEASTWYFMSVRPDDWYKPWRVKFKTHSYCPKESSGAIAYPNVQSYTWTTLTGRADSTAYANWNDKYDNAHYYVAAYPLKKAGYDAGYGHAVGISIIYGTGYTNSNYYRTFEIDYYDCENCTVTLLDTPVKWSAWTGTGTTNYSNNIVVMNAVDRGLQETGDANTTTDNRIGYFAGKTGDKGIWATSLFMEDANGTYQNICTASDGTVTSSNRTTAKTKIANTNGFKPLGKVWYTNTTYAANTNISSSGVVYSSISLFDSRYAFNTELVANSLTPYKEIYLVGTINPTYGLFYLDTVWWTQTPTDTTKIYVLVGACFDSTTSNCRITLYEQNKWYKYDGSKLVEIAGDAISVNGHTVESDVPSDAEFTDTTYTFTSGTNGFTVTPEGGSAQTVTVTPSIANNITGTGTSGYLTKFNGTNTITNGPQLGSDTTKYLRNDGTWQVPTGTTYTAGTGISISGTTISAKNSELAPYEENIQWGGNAISGSVSPEGMAISAEHSANRLAFMNPAALYYEYSADGGTTWVDYGVSDNDKPKFCTENYTLSLPLGRPTGTSEAPTLLSRTRVTITANNGTTQYLYTRPRKMLINVSTAKPMTLVVETRTGTNYLNDRAWDTFGTYTLQGMSGWNDIPLLISTLGGSISQTGNIWQLRLTFSLPELHATSKAADVLGIRIYGDTAWYTANKMANMGHIYAFDMAQNVTFPANLRMNNGKQVTYLSATPTTGQVVVTDGTLGGVKTTGYTIAKSVPSNAVFTDTTYTFTNGDDSFSVTPSGGSAQAVKVNAYHLRLNDTRSDNQLPSWYMTNHPRSTIEEFKSCSAIGVNSLISTAYCTLITITPWADTSGSAPVQLATSSAGVRAQRVATAADTWGSWIALPNSDTTYTFAGGTNKITVTPSGGTASDVNITVDDNTKLPLTGGTLTGDVFMTRGTDSQRKLGFLNDSDKFGGLKLNNSGNNIDFGWDYDSAAGSGAYFRGSGYNPNRGEFGFYARSSNSPTVQLVGYSSGVLTWNGKRVVTATNNTQIGSPTKPVYVNGSGYVTECSLTTRNIFVDTVTTPYNVGDLWFGSDGTFQCITAKASGEFDIEDWEEIPNGYLDTDEVMALINQTTQAVTGGGSILWHDSDNDGKYDEFLLIRNDNSADPVTLSNATSVYKFTNNGLYYSSTGYNGTYTTILTPDGKGIADFLQSGTLDASKVTITNFNASMITAGLLKRGGTGNAFGEIEIYNASGVVIGKVDNTGVTLYGVGQVGQRPYIKFNDTVGFAGYDAADNLVFQVVGDEFRTKKMVVSDEISVGGKLKFLPITIMEGSNVVNDGVAIVGFV